jgi:hypothetical protein
MVKGTQMVDLSLPAPQRKTLEQALAKLVRMFRGRPTRSQAIDPDSLPDHLQRDLGFRDGHATPASSARAGGVVRR